MATTAEIKDINYSIDFLSDILDIDDGIFTGVLRELIPGEQNDGFKVVPITPDGNSFFTSLYYAAQTHTDPQVKTKFNELFGITEGSDAKVAIRSIREKLANLLSEDTVIAQKVYEKMRTDDELGTWATISKNQVEPKQLSTMLQLGEDDSVIQGLVKRSAMVVEASNDEFRKAFQNVLAEYISREESPADSYIIELVRELLNNEGSTFKIKLAIATPSTINKTNYDFNTPRLWLLHDIKTDTYRFYRQTKSREEVQTIKKTLKTEAFEKVFPQGPKDGLKTRNNIAIGLKPRSLANRFSTFELAKRDPVLGVDSSLKSKTSNAAIFENVPKASLRPDLNLKPFNLEYVEARKETQRIMEELAKNKFEQNADPFVLLEKLKMVSNIEIEPITFELLDTIKKDIEGSKPNENLYCFVISKKDSSMRGRMDGFLNYIKENYSSEETARAFLVEVEIFLVKNLYTSTGVREGDDPSNMYMFFDYNNLFLFGPADIGLVMIDREKDKLIATNDFYFTRKKTMGGRRFSHKQPHAHRRKTHKNHK